MSSSWLVESTCNWIQQLCVYVLKCGSVPKHIAIIMDGNRRFARRNRVDKHQGHVKGFDTLAETLQWSLEMGINELTVYAFSIENFKRSKEEIDKLMELAKEKFKILIDEWKKLREHGVCVRVVGNISLLPKDVLCLAVVAMLLTKDNKRAYLNIALSYTSREEMCQVASKTIQGLRNGQIGERNLTNKLVDDCLYTYQSAHPEVLIRTSGAMRLSDFLTVQCSQSYLHCVRALWPEFCPWDLITGVFNYQQFHSKLQKLKENSFQESECYVNPDKGIDVDDRAKQFTNSVQKDRLKQLLSICVDNPTLRSEATNLEEHSSEKVYEFYKAFLVPTKEPYKIVI